MISCCAEEASADLLTQNTISNPKRFSVFSVVFQRGIPKCISLMLILCFEHAEVCKYFSVLLRFSVVFVRFSESNSLRFKLWVRVSRCNLPIFLLCPWSSQFSIFFLIKQFLCWGLEGIMKFDKGEKWLAGEVFFFLLSLFFFSLNSPIIVSHFKSLCFCYSSITLLHYLFSLSHWTKSLVFALYSVLSLVLTLTRSLMFPFLHLSLALALSFTDNLRVASIHFSARELSTPLLTQNPKGRKLKKESRRREN